MLLSVVHPFINGTITGPSPETNIIASPCASSLLSICYQSRINLVSLPKDTPNIPKGYPKDNSLKLYKMHIYYIYTLYIYTFR